MNLERLVGTALWSMAGAEHCAVATCRLLVVASGEADLLRDDERRFLEETFQAQEIEHARCFAGWARRFAPQPLKPSPWLGQLRRDQLRSCRHNPRRRFLMALTTLNTDERYVRASVGSTTSTLAIADPQLAVDYRQIMDEERGHVEWGRRVLGRLTGEDPTTKRIVRLHRGLNGAVFPALLHQTFTPTFAALRQVSALRQAAAATTRDSEPEEIGAPHWHREEREYP